MKRESVIQRFSSCAALIFLVLTSGCFVGPRVKAYSGDKLQKSDVAVIKGWCYFALFGYECYDIYEIDGSYLKATNVEVLPGWHELVIRDFNFSFVAPVGLPPQYLRAAFNFETGHKYKIKTHFKGILMEGMDIIDATTGAIIFSGSW
jgi:hypothetical protein